MATDYKAELAAIFRPQITDAEGNIDPYPYSEELINSRFTNRWSDTPDDTLGFHQASGGKYWTPEAIIDIYKQSQFASSTYTKGLTSDAEILEYMNSGGETIAKGNPDNPFDFNVRWIGPSGIRNGGNFEEPDSFLDSLGLYIVGGIATAGLMAGAFGGAAAAGEAAFGGGLATELGVAGAGMTTAEGFTALGITSAAEASAVGLGEAWLASAGPAAGLGAADIAGLTQMAADAGLTGSAAADFVASGGTLGSTAAAAAAGAGAANITGLSQMAADAGLTGQAAADFVASGGTQGSTAAGGGGVGFGASTGITELSGVNPYIEGQPGIDAGGDTMLDAGGGQGGLGEAPKSVFDRIMDSKFMSGDQTKANLVKAGAEFVAKGFGRNPQAEAVDLARARLDAEMAELARKNNNSNNITGLNIGMRPNSSKIASLYPNGVYTPIGIVNRQRAAQM